MHLKASSAVIVPSTSFTVKACHSRKKENALSFDQVEQMLFNFMKQKQTWKSNYSTVRLFILVSSSLNFPSVFLCIIDCMIYLEVLTKLLRNYAACERHLFNRSTPYSGRSRPSDNGGPGHPDPEISGWGGGSVSKKFFSALWASVWSNNKEG